MNCIQKAGSTLFGCFQSQSQEAAEVLIEVAAPPQKLEPQPFEGKKLVFGDREIKKQILDEFKIKVGHGRLGTPVGKGAFGTVSDFYFNNSQGSGASTSDEAEWVFKPEYPLDQGSYEKKLRTVSRYPLTESGWLHSTLRSVASYQIACKMGIDNIVETHIGFAGSTPGALMRKVQGQTLDKWLVDKGYFKSVGVEGGYTEERVEQLRHSENRDDIETCKGILREAFQKAAEKTGWLADDWNKLRNVDFITGQSDRLKLTNMMISEINGRSRLIGIDNDISFPETNDIPLHVPPKSAVTPSTAPSRGTEMVKKLFPKALNAFNKRVSAAEGAWFAQGGEHSVRIGSNIIDEKFSSLNSGSGGKSDDDVFCDKRKFENKNLIAEPITAYETPETSRLHERRCTIM